MGMCSPTPRVCCVTPPHPRRRPGGGGHGHGTQRTCFSSRRSPLRQFEAGRRVRRTEQRINVASERQRISSRRVDLSRRMTTDGIHSCGQTTGEIAHRTPAPVCLHDQIIIVYPSVAAQTAIIICLLKAPMVAPSTLPLRSLLSLCFLVLLLQSCPRSRPS